MSYVEKHVCELPEYEPVWKDKDDSVAPQYWLCTDCNTLYTWATILRHRPIKGFEKKKPKSKFARLFLYDDTREFWYGQSLEFCYSGWRRVPQEDWKVGDDGKVVIA